MQRFFSSLAFALAFVALCLVPQNVGAEDIFTVSGIHVDATGPSATAAQLTAIAQGRPKAWAILYKRISRPQDAGRMPKLDDAGLLRIGLSFTIKNERRSTTRYVADVTYSFSPEGVARVMQAEGIPFTQGVQVKRILLVPYSPNYSTGSLWTSALSPRRYSSSAVPFALPGAGADALSDLSFDATNWRDIEPFASRIRANEAALVRVAPGPGHLTITIKRIGAGQLPVRSSFDVPMLPGGAAGTYSSAADAAVHEIEEIWKHPPEVAPTGRLTADVHVSSLAQWGAFQTDLASVPNVSAVDVKAVDIGAARIAITYLGTQDQLREALADQGMILTRVGGDWMLSPSGSP